MKKLTAKRTIITLIIMAIAILFLESCKSAGVCGSAKMIGYKDGNNARQIIKNNR